MTEKEFKAAIKAKDKIIDQLRGELIERQVDLASLLYYARENARRTEEQLSHYEHRNPDSVLCRPKF